MRVVIADDSVIVREGIASILTRAGIEVAAQASDPGELLREVDAHRPDVAIVDIRMPPTHTDEGLRAAHELRARHPGIGILILSQYVEAGIATRLLAEDPESLGYVLKDRVADVDEFARTLERVAEGGSALDPQIVSQLLAADRHDGPLQTLTPREREVLELIAEGRANPAIADAARHHPAQHREARDEHLRQARAPRGRGRSPPRARRAALPARLIALGRSGGRAPGVPPPWTQGAPTARAARAGDARPMSINVSEGPAPTAAAPPAAGPTPHAVVTARDVVRRYGDGDTAVDALRGVSVDIAEGRLTAVMGPSGSGKSTLMHILAGLDTPTSGEVTVAGIDITNLDDNALTRLRRDHIGFIFQFFNLLPMLTAAENVALPLKLAGAKPDPRLARAGHRHRRPRRAASGTVRPSCPAASSSASPWPAPSSRARASCSPTSRPATSTPR